MAGTERVSPDRVRSFLKRAFDVCVSGIALVLLAPLFLVVAVAVKVDSRGPVFYRQTRVGRDGCLFSIWKFRTMARNADRMAANVSPADDPRITRVGRTLRSWYVDELPQLINVLVGHMSLVGPRPETPEYVALYSPEERRVLALKPGMAGPSTLAFMDEPELLAVAENAEFLYVDRILHERVRVDLAYLDDLSIGYDLRLLGRQAMAILRKRNGRHPSGI
jgi:lipopolysaccharide/colanic/teichoic acid biosynthesis glycosyltransferase